MQVLFLLPPSAVMHSGQWTPHTDGFFCLQKTGEIPKDAASAAPRLVHTSDLLELYHKQETSFGTPKAVVYLVPSPSLLPAAAPAAPFLLQPVMILGNVPKLMVPQSHAFLPSISGGSSSLKVLCSHWLCIYCQLVCPQIIARFPLETLLMLQISWLDATCGILLSEKASFPQNVRSHLQAFHCPEAYTTPEAAVLTRLFVKMLDDRLSELSYDAELAGLGYSILNTTYGFLVSFGG